MGNGKAAAFVKSSAAEMGQLLPLNAEAAVLFFSASFCLTLPLLMLSLFPRPSPSYVAEEW